MSLGSIILGIIAGYLIWRIYLSVVKEKNIKIPGNKICLISKDTGEIVEMQLMREPLKKDTNTWNDETFLLMARSAFQRVVTAFAAENLKELKTVLSSTVYNIFEKDILKRQKEKKKMDFSLVCFDSVTITEKNEKADTITVRFVTEQINLLKNDAGQVIEGDPLSIATVTDLWQFQKNSNGGWVITTTESQV